MKLFCSRNTSLCPLSHCGVEDVRESAEVRLDAFAAGTLLAPFHASVKGDRGEQRSAKWVNIPT